MLLQLILIFSCTPPLLAHQNVKVVGGVNASIGEFPFTLSLQMKPVFGDQYHFCGGVIIDKSFVLTAGNKIMQSAPLFNYFSNFYRLEPQLTVYTAVMKHKLK